MFVYTTLYDHVFIVLLFCAVVYCVHREKNYSKIKVIPGEAGFRTDCFKI